MIKKQDPDVVSRVRKPIFVNPAHVVRKIGIELQPSRLASSNLIELRRRASKLYCNVLRKAVAMAAAYSFIAFPKYASLGSLLNLAE